MIFVGHVQDIHWLCLAVELAADAEMGDHGYVCDTLSGCFSTRELQVHSLPP